MTTITFNEFLKLASKKLGNYGLRRAVAVWALVKFTLNQRDRAVYGKQKYKRVSGVITKTLISFFTMHTPSAEHSNLQRNIGRLSRYVNRIANLSYPDARRLVQATVRDACSLGLVTQSKDDGWFVGLAVEFDGKQLQLTTAKAAAIDLAGPALGVL